MATKTSEFMVRGMPWKIQISKTRSSHLGVTLQLNADCGSVFCKMLVKVISPKPTVRSIEKCVTKTYEHLTDLNATELLLWDDLVNEENGFVNDNSITLEIKIESDNPEECDIPNRKRAKLHSQNELKSSQHFSVTPCGHLFCTACIKIAIKRRAVCPTCKKGIQLNTLRSHAPSV